jgi:hypothetical protein
MWFLSKAEQAKLSDVEVQRIRRRARSICQEAVQSGSHSLADFFAVMAPAEYVEQADLHKAGATNDWASNDPAAA